MAHQAGRGVEAAEPTEMGQLRIKNGDGLVHQQVKQCGPNAGTSGARRSTWANVDDVNYSLVLKKLWHMNVELRNVTIGVFDTVKEFVTAELDRKNWDDLQPVKTRQEWTLRCAPVGLSESLEQDVPFGCMPKLGQMEVMEISMKHTWLPRMKCVKTPGNTFAVDGNGTRIRIENDRFCPFVERKDYACTLRLKISFSDADESVTVEITTDGHNHGPKAGTSKLTDAVKKRIAELADQAPCRREFTSCFPPDEPFVLGYEVESPDKFFVVWTTMKLLERQLSADHLQVDAMNGLNWHNYPLMVGGYSDVDSSFVPTLLAVGPTENGYMYKALLRTLRVAEFSPKFVLADGTPALTTAAKDEFPNAIRGMCSAYFIRQFNKRKSQMSKEEFEKLRSDVEILRHARNIDEFNRACTMMLEAWNHMESESLDDFAKYVTSTWLDGQLFGWFEGLVPYVVNNNGLESLNASIKRDHTLRRTLPLPGFIESVEKMLRYWVTSLKDEPTFPETPLKVFKAAYELAQQSRLYYKVANEDAYIATSSVAKHTTPESLFAAYQRSFVSEPSTWDEYCNRRYEVYKVARSALCGGSYYACTCSEGTKKRVCKHAVLIMCEAAKVAQFPPAATAKPLVNSRRKKPTEGRPPLAAPQNRHAIA